MVQVTRIARIQTPAKSDIENLRKWLLRPGMGGNFLVGVESHTWTKAGADDLMSPAVREQDGFNSLLTGQILDAYHRIYGHKKKASKNFGKKKVKACRT